MLAFLMRQWHVYGLTDPRDSKVRYVGWAFDPARRLKAHLYRCTSEANHKAAWLRQLSTLGLEPSLLILETNSGDWASAERRWIAHYRAMGADLTNSTDGGEGVVGLVFSSASRAKMAAAKRGRKHTAEHVEKVAMALRGRSRPPEAMRAAQMARLGSKHTPDTIEKIREASLGRKHSEETRARMSVSRRGRRHTAETIAKIKATKRARASQHGQQELFSHALPP